MLLVVSEVYRQQLELFKKNKQSIEDRIVSLYHFFKDVIDLWKK